jgi:DNA polymerase type B, organellar and viral
MKPVYTLDFETDPFEHGKRVYPFCVGLYNGKDFDSIWSQDCPELIVKRLRALEPGIVYMHNGGRFDIFYLLPWLESDLRIINGRIVMARIGKHEIRDSWAILPIALAQYKKDEIAYEKLHAVCRELHKAEIVSYLRTDCVALHELVTAFRDEFGDALTIGSAAMAQMKRFHPFMHMQAFDDEKVRKQFFFGGRVECFQGGIIDQEFKIYDVNSMYPFVMSNYRHPDGRNFSVDKRIGKSTAFVTASGYSLGAFAVRRDTGNAYPRERGTFAATIHEFNAAVECGLFRPDRVLKVYNFDQWIMMDEFVDHFYRARQKAKAEEDKIHDIFYKLILNSSYGKYAQNPDNYHDFSITRNGQRLPSPWEPRYVYNNGEFIISRKPVARHAYYNVAIGASITGAARSVLLRALATAKDPIYCDTDSIIARKIKVETDTAKLGAWKLEGTGDRVAIAGKKMYACFDGDTCIKQASKGARVTPEEIVRVAQGETVTFRKDAPTFKLDGRVEFITRELRRTV